MNNLNLFVLLYSLTDYSVYLSSLVEALFFWNLYIFNLECFLLIWLDFFGLFGFCWALNF